jgi:hypothetical protein
MFRILSVLFIISSLLWLFNFAKKNNFSVLDVLNNFLSSLNSIFSELKNIRSNSQSKNFILFKKFFYLFTLFIFLIMAVSSYLPAIFSTKSLSGIFLLIHVTAAPLFAISLTVAIILYANSNRFNKNDLLLEKSSILFSLNISGLLKLIFWMIALFSVSAMLSIILNMFPLFGTEGQLYLLEMHRYSTLILLILVIFHIGLTTAKK